MARRGRYIICIEDGRRLRNVVRRPVKLPLLAAGLVAIAFVLMALGWIIGYRWAGGRDGRLALNQRAELTDMLLRMDSLMDRASLNSAYIRNVGLLMDTGRLPSDSTLLAHPVPPAPPDSLLDATPYERAFTASIERQGGYRVSALARVDAEGVSFTPIAMAGVQTRTSVPAEEAEIIVPVGDPVLAPADARIVDIHYSNLDGGFTLVLQHQRGFMSRLSGLGQVIVDQGSTLKGGDPVGFGSGRTSSLRGTVRLRLWHNGAPIIPAEYIDLSGPTSFTQR